MRDYVLLSGEPGHVDGLFFYYGLDQVTDQGALPEDVAQYMTSGELAAYMASGLHVEVVSSFRLEGYSMAQLDTAAAALRLHPLVCPAGYTISG